jgi:hypothetical protein
MVVNGLHKNLIVVIEMTKKRDYDNLLYSYMAITGFHGVYQQFTNNFSTEELRLHNMYFKDDKVPLWFLPAYVPYRAFRYFIQSRVANQNRTLRTGSESPRVRFAVSELGDTSQEIWTESKNEVNFPVGTITSQIELTNVATLAYINYNTDFDSSCDLQKLKNNLDIILFSHSGSLILEVLRGLLSLGGDNLWIGSDYSNPAFPTTTRLTNIIFPAVSVGLVSQMIQVIKDIEGGAV